MSGHLMVAAAVAVGQMGHDFEDQEVGAGHDVAALRLPSEAISSSSTWTCSCIVRWAETPASN